MKLARARIAPIGLPLRAPLRTGRGVIRTRASAVVALESADGATGFGEATPPWGDATAESLAAEVERLCTALIGVELSLPRGALARLDAVQAVAPAARSPSRPLSSTSPAARGASRSHASWPTAAARGSAWR